MDPNRGECFRGIQTWVRKVKDWANTRLEESQAKKLELEGFRHEIGLKVHMSVKTLYLPTPLQTFRPSVKTLYLSTPFKPSLASTIAPMWECFLHQLSCGSLLELNQRLIWSGLLLIYAIEVGSTTRNSEFTKGITFLPYCYEIYYA